MSSRDPFDDLDLEALSRMSDEEIRLYSITDDERKFYTGMAETKFSIGLLSQPKETYLQILKSFPSPTAEKVSALEIELNEKAQKISPGKPYLHILDPDLFTMGVFFEMTTSIISGHLLNHKGLAIDKMELNFDYSPFYSVATSKDGKAVPYILPFGDYYSQRMGIDREIESAYVTTHEFYHFIDPVFVPACAGSMYYTPDSKLLLEDPKALQNLVHVIQAELFADAASLADMIKHGHSLDIIDPVIQDRLLSKDIGHCTAKGLEAIKQNISLYGVDNFRKFDDKEIVDFCVDQVKENAPTAPQLYQGAKIAFLKTHVASPDNSSISFSHASEKLEDIEAGYFYADYLDRTDLSARDSNLLDDTPESMAFKLPLIKKAFEEHGVITPETMARAYVTTLQEFRDGAEGDNKIGQFVKVLHKPINYLAENIARGINPFDKVSSEWWPDKDYFDPKYLSPVIL